MIKNIRFFNKIVLLVYDASVSTLRIYWNSVFIENTNPYANPRKPLRKPNANLRKPTQTYANLYANPRKPYANLNLDANPTLTYGNLYANLRKLYANPTQTLAWGSM